MRVRRMAGAVATAITLMALAACTGDPADEAARNTAPVIQPGKPGETNKTLSPEEAQSGVPVVKPNEADVTYVRDMIYHHRQALQMTALVPDRAVDQQVKGLASRISDAQGPEIDAMNRWLSTNFQQPVGDDHGHGAHDGMPGMATPEQMAKLGTLSGAEFDRMFLELMIKHHQGAIEMANKVQTSGADVTVQEMADHVVAEQSDEIRRMQGMLAA